MQPYDCDIADIGKRIGEKAEDKFLLIRQFEHALEGMFREEEQEFIRECFRKGEKKMISGFEQIVIEERENAKQEGIEQGMSSERERGMQVLIESCKKFGQTAETAIEIIMQNYSLSSEDAQAFVKRYWTVD